MYTTKTISDKFFGGGLIINPLDSENIRKLDYDVIVKLFEKNGVILFRDFSLKPEEITEITDLYTLRYGNDAHRRSSRMGQKLIRNVDYESHDALLRANRNGQQETHNVNVVKKKDEDWKEDYDNFEEMSLHSDGSYAPDYHTRRATQQQWWFLQRLSPSFFSYTVQCPYNFFQDVSYIFLAF